MNAKNFERSIDRLKSERFCEGRCDTGAFSSVRDSGLCGCSVPVRRIGSSDGDELMGGAEVSEGAMESMIRSVGTKRSSSFAYAAAVAAA